MQMAEAMPHRCTHLVNLDGLPSRRSWPDVPDHERTRLLAGEFAPGSIIGHQRRARSARPARSTSSPRGGQRMNPRLTLEWLRYLVTIGA